MVWVLVRHKVEDYEKWKPVFDESKAKMKEHGALQFMVTRDRGDGNLVSVGIAWPSFEDAEAFMSSEWLKEAMGRAGVLQPLTVFHMEPADACDFTKCCCGG